MGKTAHQPLALGTATQLKTRLDPCMQRKLERGRQSHHAFLGALLPFVQDDRLFALALPVGAPPSPLGCPVAALPAAVERASAAAGAVAGVFRGDGLVGARQPRAGRLRRAPRDLRQLGSGCGFQGSSKSLAQRSGTASGLMGLKSYRDPCEAGSCNHRGLIVCCNGSHINILCKSWTKALTCDTDGLTSGDRLWLGRGGPLRGVPTDRCPPGSWSAKPFC